MSRFNLEVRTLKFARDIKEFVKSINLNIYNQHEIKQLLRSSSSVGANYIEANDSLSRKDYFYRVRICKKEAKESQYWLNLIENETQLKDLLVEESVELQKIFGAIIKNSNN